MYMSFCSKSTEKTTELKAKRCNEEKELVDIYLMHEETRKSLDMLSLQARIDDLRKKYEVGTISDEELKTSLNEIVAASSSLTNLMLSYQERITAVENEIKQIDEEITQLENASI